MTKSESKRCILIGVAVLVFLLVVTVTALWITRQDQQELYGRYGIVFDVGGSGTRMYLYEYQHARNMNQKLSVKCENKGASHQKPTELQSHIIECLKKAAEEVPDHQQVPIYMAASAGLRLLKHSNLSAYNNVWKALREVLHNSSFVVKRADTLSGKEEGSFSWTAVNTLLHRDKVGSGLFEVGSTSFQLAFDSDNTNEELEKRNSIEVNMDHKAVDVYAISYLCYGLNEIIRRYRAFLVQNATSTIIDDPCGFTGDERSIKNEYFGHSHCIKGNLADEIFGSSIYVPSNDLSRVYTFRGKGNFDSCLINLNITLSKALHTRQHHPLTHGLFTAIGGGTYFGSIFLNLPQKLTIKEYKNASKSLCNKTYSQITSSPGFDKYAFQFCLADTYSYILLSNVLNLDDRGYLEFINKIDGQKVGWPLGMMVNNIKNMSPAVTSTKRYISKAIFLVVLVASILSLIVIFVLIIRSLNSQLNTSSDKGLDNIISNEKANGSV